MLPSVPRIVAIGDLHGDMDKARRAFRVGGLIDEHDRWAGGTTTAVQVRPRLLSPNCSPLMACVSTGAAALLGGPCHPRSPVSGAELFERSGWKRRWCGRSAISWTEGTMSCRSCTS